MSENFPTFKKIFSIIYHIPIGKVFIGIFIFLCAKFIADYTQKPLVIETGIDWGRRVLFANLVIDILVWALLGYLIYTFVKPAFKLKMVWVLAIGLAVLFTLGTLAIDSSASLHKTSYSTGYRLYEYDNDLDASRRTDVKKGWPFDYYHHWIGYSSSNQIAYEFKEIETDYLTVNFALWFIVAAILIRLLHLFLAKKEYANSYLGSSQASLSKNRILGYTFLVLILAIIVGAVYWYQYSSEKKINQENYYPGEVVVAFKQSVSINDMKSFLKKMSLQSKEEISPMISFLIYGNSPGVAQTQLENEIIKLKQEKVITTCQAIRVVPKTQNATINCDLNSTIPIQDAETIVYNHQGLTWFPGKYALTNTTVVVPNGQEDEWIERLEQYPEIDYAVKNSPPSLRWAK